MPHGLMGKPRPRLAGQPNPAMTGQDRSAFGGRGNMVPPKMSAGAGNARNRSIQGDRSARAKAAKGMIRRPGGRNAQGQAAV